MFFHSWAGLWRVLVGGVSAYAGLVVLLRVSGKRTLAKMNAFDLIVTVALGSILATILLSKDVAVAEGLVAFGTLIGLQFVIAWLSVRSRTASKIVKSEPSLLLFRGQLLHDALRRQRVTEGEVRAALRQSGHGELEAAEAVVLETDGTFSVVARIHDGPVQTSALTGVTGYPDSAGGPSDP